MKMAVRKQRKPSFFWQGVLILLPVTLMSAFGFWAILRQRNAVEQDARQRAAEIIQSLPNEFGRMFANRLTFYDVSKNGWFSYLQWGLAAWPDDKTRKQYLGDTNEVAIITREVADLKKAFPEWTNGSPPLVDFMLATNGETLGLEVMPPRPPQWLSALSDQQHQAWTALVAADYRPESLSDITALTKTFEQTSPPNAARICAEFIRLRAESKTQSATNAMNNLLRFSGRHYDVEFESGLPLTTLALAEALKRARECGPTAQLWEALRREINSPGALTPNLLDEAANLVANDVQLSQSIFAMRILLADKQSQLELSDAVRQTGKLNGITTTNLWVDAMSRRWFCILQPGYSESWRSISNHLTATATNYFTKVECYPESLVTRSFSAALADAKISLPPYFGIFVELEGEPIGDSENYLTDSVLAMKQGQMFLPAMYSERDPNGGPEKETMFESMPSHPRFTASIVLADRRLLYAKQRQLQFTFGSLIGLSAIAALIGFFAALFSFRRQQQLNEMKSNFVSSVSHELRAPIASVRLLAENLERGKIPEAKKQNDYFHFIVQECRRLSSLI